MYSVHIIHVYISTYYVPSTYVRIIWYTTPYEFERLHLNEWTYRMYTYLTQLRFSRSKRHSYAPFKFKPNTSFYVATTNVSSRWEYAFQRKSQQRKSTPRMMYTVVVVIVGQSDGQVELDKEFCAWTWTETMYEKFTFFFFHKIWY